MVRAPGARCGRDRQAWLNCRPSRANGVCNMMDLTIPPPDHYTGRQNQS